jgi:hypothetical protein
MDGDVGSAIWACDAMLVKFQLGGSTRHAPIFRAPVYPCCRNWVFYGLRNFESVLNSFSTTSFSHPRALSIPAKKMFDAYQNARVKELFERIEMECDLGKVAELLAELRDFLDEPTKPPSTIMGRSPGGGHTSGKLPS